MRSFVRLRSVPKLWLLLVAVGSLSGCSLRQLGRNIPQPDIESDYFIAVVWGLVLAISIGVWPVRKEDKKPLILVWIVKLLVTLGAMLVYEYNYGLDAYYYFAEPNVPGFVWEGLEFGNGTQNMLQLSWLHQQIISNSYHALKVSCAMIGMIGVYVFYRALASYLKRDDPRLFYGLALFPSILFWSSILGKDPIALLGICLYGLAVVRYYQTGRIRYVPVMAIGVVLAMIIRVWMGPILLAPLSVFVVIRMSSRIMKGAFLAAVVVAFLFAFNRSSEQFNIETSEDVYLATTTVSRMWAYGGSSQQIEQEFTSLGTMIAFMPLGIVTALFRPLPGEVLNLFGFLAGAENVLLIVMLIRAWRRSRLADFKDPIILWALLVVLVWASIYGFVSYQNMGSAVRFRLQVMPFMLALMAYLGRQPIAAMAGPRLFRPQVSSLQRSSLAKR